MNLTYWYPMNDWTPGAGPDPAIVREAAARYETMGVTNLVIGIDGRKMSYQWDYLDGFASRAFRADLETALAELYAGGYTGRVELMPVAGLYNWESQNHQRTFWMVDATLTFLRDSAFRDRVAGIVTDTEFAPTPEWRDADDRGRAEILSQYAGMLAGIETRVKAFDPALTTTTYHGTHVDGGDDRYLLDGVNYGDAAVIGAHVDRIILPVRLTDAIDPDVPHDFDRLVARAVAQTAEELAHLSGTGTTILIDFEWEESHRGLGAPNFYDQLRGAFTAALLEHPVFAGFAVFISPTLSTVEVRDLRIEGLWLADSLKGTAGDDTIRGRTGEDTLSGGDGNDVLNGQSGHDMLSGGAGDDSLLGGDGADLLDGGEGRDRLKGGDGADLLRGGQGNDRLYGNAGNDTLLGNAGGDRLYGRTGDDLLAGGHGNDVLRGGTGNDTLLGGGNADSLHGGLGDDVLQGDDPGSGPGGDDTLTGGGGVDRFVFAGARIGHDVVTDYAAGEDLYFDQSLWGGGLSSAQVVAQFADDSGADVVFDFGGENTVTLTGLASKAGLDAEVFFL